MGSAIGRLFCFAQTVRTPFRQSQNIIRADFIVIAEREKVLDRHFLFAAFIFAHLVFGGAQNISDLRL